MPQNSPEHVDPFDESDLHLWVKLEHLARYQYAADMLKAVAPGFHLDVGCATGYGLREVVPHTTGAVGVDYDAVVLGTAARLLREYPVELVTADLDLDNLALALGQRQFDSVTAFEVFEHLEDARTTLMQLTDRVRGGGLLLASVPNARYDSKVDGHHHRIFAEGEFAALLDGAGFAVEHVLGQATVHRINRRETRLVRQGAFSLRPSDLPALHEAEIVAKMARLLAWPEARDVADSYAHIFVAMRR